VHSLEESTQTRHTSKRGKVIPQEEKAKVNVPFNPRNRLKPEAGKTIHAKRRSLQVYEELHRKVLRVAKISQKNNHEVRGAKDNSYPSHKECALKGSVMNSHL